MNKKAIIYDLDNTIYSVLTIGEVLFAPLFKLIEQSGDHGPEMSKISDEIMRKPFQVVAASYNFSDALTQKGINLLKDITYTGAISPFTDYPEIKKLPAARYLVTTGFYKLQYSKIRGMGIEQDFREIHVVDPATSTKTKKEVFAEIMARHHYQPAEVLVVGDDPDSEIRAARELGIETVLYDKFNHHPGAATTYQISDFSQLSIL